MGLLSTRRLSKNARRLKSQHQDGVKLVNDAGSPAPFADPAYESLPEVDGVPEVAAGDLSPELVRAAMLRNGCLLVRGLVPRDEALRLAQEIDRAYEAREAGDAEYFDPFVPEAGYDVSAIRSMVNGAAGLIAADSPPVMVEVLETFERTGLRELAEGYLGEPPTISIEKSLLRKVDPVPLGVTEDGSKPSAWHQDGAFLGEVRALNVWLALSRCGDQAPGLDVVPKRLDEIVPTGTEGASFSWSVSHTVAEEASDGAGIARPLFDPGDVLLFDELFLHATASEPGMTNPRYAVESWFFAPSGFPPEYAPLAV